MKPPSICNKHLAQLASGTSCTSGQIAGLSSSKTGQSQRLAAAVPFICSSTSTVARNLSDSSTQIAPEQRVPRNSGGFDRGRRFFVPFLVGGGRFSTFPGGRKRKTGSSNICTSDSVGWSLRCFSTSVSPRESTTNFAPSSMRVCPFGLISDIDGVLCRGPKLLGGVELAMRYLTDQWGRFRVPSVFVTNAGNALRAEKAKSLSDKLQVDIHADQVIMSHSPLRMFDQFHNRHVLVVGQGPILDIAAGLGFKKVSTIENIKHAFPNLDCVDHSRCMRPPCGFSHYFPAIEAVILFGPPVQWEASLQILVDVLMTNGKPSDKIKPGDIPYPHIPVLACNIDMLWMAEINLPRLGHGAFLLCMEALYRKLTGHEVKYTALLGKPSELTYHWAEYRLRQMAKKMGIGPPKTIYAIGDNPETDILGANLYHQYLSQRKLQKKVKKERMSRLERASVPFQMEQRQAMTVSSGGFAPRATLSTLASDPGADQGSADPDWNPQEEPSSPNVASEECLSVLVETGLFGAESQPPRPPTGGFMGVLEDLSLRSHLRSPNFVERDFLSAMRMIFTREDFPLSY